MGEEVGSATYKKHNDRHRSGGSDVHPPKPPFEVQFLNEVNAISDLEADQELSRAGHAEVCMSTRLPEVTLPRHL